MMPEMPLAAATEPQGYYTSVYSGGEIDAAIGALLSNVTIYSATSTYEQGAYVLYDGQLYTANQTISSPEPWNPAHWTKVNILDVLKNAATRAVPAVAGNLATLSSTGDLQDSGLLPTQAGVRKNLLDNWYFVGGGTDGNFPVNQRGQTNYTTDGYNVDRWICNEAGVSAVKNGISIPAGTYFFQRLPGKLLAGKTVTMSVLFADGDLVSGTGIVSTSGIANIYPLNNNVRLYSENNSETNFIAFVVYVGTARTISAIKLELGETQTLARQTDSGWELLEIPDYATELLACQTYCQLYSSAENRPSKAVDCRPTMRVDPTQGTIAVDGVTYYYNSAEL